MRDAEFDNDEGEVYENEMEEKREREASKISRRMGKRKEDTKGWKAICSLNTRE
jgi:hypothetical protein